MEEKMEPKPSISEKEKPAEVANFSSTIKNAHASGDGSIKRSDEAVDTPKEASKGEEPETKSY